MVRFHATQSTILRASLAVVISALLILGSATQAFAASEHHTCNSVEVATFTDRVHVRCAQGPAWSVPGSVEAGECIEPRGCAGIVFFAVATADSAHAARILSVLMMAHLAPRAPDGSPWRKIVIEYDRNDTTGPSFGCLEEDCRPILSVAVR
jgi:hypothetical protein